jgi:hypothetical protein
MARIQSPFHNLSKAVYRRGFRTLFFRIKGFSTRTLSSTKIGLWAVMNS